MTLQTFGLTAEQKLKRRDGIGGSDANKIMSGDQAAILRLWEEKTGQVEDEDLSQVLPVQMGLWTEPLNRHWYTMKTGFEVGCVGECVQHINDTFMRCTLDGRVEAERAIYEAKHVNQFAKPAEIEQKYMAQLHHNMHVCGVERAVLSYFMGTLGHDFCVIEADPFYTATLIERERIFWDCVTSMTPPGDMPAPIAPIAPEKMRVVDMTGRNEWAACAADWLLHRAHAKTFKSAEEALKGQVEFDVGEATGHGVKISRAKNGALTIREMKS